MQKKFLFVSWLILSAGIAVTQLNQQRFLEPEPFIGAAVFISFCLAAQMFLERRYARFDPYLLPLTVFFISIGLTMIYRLKPALFTAQLHWAHLGIIIFFIIAVFAKKFRLIIQYKYMVGLFALLMLAVTILFGSEIGGGRNWIILGPVRFQPSEFAKIAIIVFLAAYLVEHEKILSEPERKKFGLSLPPARIIAPLLLVWGMALLMFVLQRDLGSALLFFGIALSMTYMATGNLSYIAMAGAFFSISSAASYFLFSHVRVRVAVWLHPWDDPSGQAYQIVQSLFALGSGGLFGSGLACGHPEFIPEVHTDFIFSAVAEEFGLLGALALIFAYLLFLQRCFRIALRQDTKAEALLAAGLASGFAIQIFIILAGITKLLPLTGITLPYISYGGSSMAAACIMTGLLFSLSIKENNNV